PRELVEDCAPRGVRQGLEDVPHVGHNRQATACLSRVQAAVPPPLSDPLQAPRSSTRRTCRHTERAGATPRRCRPSPRSRGCSASSRTSAGGGQAQWRCARRRRPDRRHDHHRDRNHRRHRRPHHAQDVAWPRRALPAERTGSRNHRLRRPERAAGARPHRHHPALPHIRPTHSLRCVLSPSSAVVSKRMAHLRATSSGWDCPAAPTAPRTGRTRHCRPATSCADRER
ncbi:MAG: hypothetical protein QOJ29_417, partial [Thermoleophilaceae bacterium]|nr:hypothetical protein [Thermoleophilaceae bacterium]